jgi:hypothetical protein
MAFAVMSRTQATSVLSSWNTSMGTTGPKYMFLQLQLQDAVSKGMSNLTVNTSDIDSAARTRLVSTDGYTITDKAGGLSIISGW